MTQAQTVDPAAVADAEHQLKDDHKRMHGLMNKVASETDVTTLRPLLEELHARLREHFAREEYPGGFYDSMGALSPEFRKDIRKLADDHYRFLSTVRGLASRAKYVEASEAAAVVQEAHEMMGALKEHERREHEMAAEAQKLASAAD